VTLAAFETGMFAIERISSLVVVEFFLRRLPVNQPEAFTVVFGMTAHAIFIGIISFDDTGMEALVHLESLGDFRMALQALERAAPST
jgi:hypothetical protein